MTCCGGTVLHCLLFNKAVPAYVSLRVLLVAAVPGEAHNPLADSGSVYAWVIAFVRVDKCDALDSATFFKKRCCCCYAAAATGSVRCWPSFFSKIASNPQSRTSFVHISSCSKLKFAVWSKVEGWALIGCSSSHFKCHAHCHQACTKHTDRTALRSLHKSHNSHRHQACAQILN
eukprot:1160581-Pelagomonas_calceolata.AAC.8